MTLWTLARVNFNCIEVMRMGPCKDYCTITTLSSQGVMRDGCERYQTKFATSCD